MARIFTAALFLALTAQTANAQLKINELMQSNIDCIMDDLNEFPDSWVELYNSGNEAVNLQDYKLGVKDKASKAWDLPNKTINAKQYVIIYCDKEETGLHTSFRLESGKDGCVYLFKGNEIIDKLENMKKMPAPNIAYGRKTDGADEWGYQLTPTPGAANTGSISLTLSLPDGAPSNAVIRYTTNGSEPTKSSSQYQSPISISSSKVIRAKVFCDGYLSPVSTAQSYIFHPRSMTTPIFSVQTDDRYLNDKSIGLFANNNSKEDKKTHDWRRPVNIELFTSEGSESIFNQLGETRIQGGASRANALKSMVFYANKRFDPDHKRFSYEFFPDQKPGVTEFKSFSLRDGGNDFGDLYFRDLIIQRTMGPNTDLDWQAGHTAVLYINGQYMGMLNIRERSNEDNIYSNYDGLEDIDMIEIGHEQVNGQNLFEEELKEGSIDFYEDFKAFYSEKGHTKAEYEQWMDVSEYLSVVVMNLFYGNIDFPGNNLVFWRPNDDDTESGLPKIWRVIVKDTDFGLGLYGKKPDYNTIDLLYNPSKYQSDNWAFTEPATRLLKNMLENQDLQNMFIDKSCVFMGDFMNAEGTGASIDAIMDEALDEFVAHRSKYNTWGGTSRDEIINKFNDAKKWLAGYTEQGWWGQSTTYLPRTDYFLQHISKQFLNNVSAIPVTINKGVTVLPEVLVNDIKLTKGVFNGKLFLNRKITLKGMTTDAGQAVTGWDIEKTTSSGSVEKSHVDGATYTFNVPSCKSLSIKAVLGSTGIDELQRTDNSTQAGAWYSVNGMELNGQPKAKGVYVRNGKKVVIK